MPAKFEPPPAGPGPDRRPVSCAGVDTPMPMNTTSQSPVLKILPVSAAVLCGSSVTFAPAAESCCCASSDAGANDEPASVGNRNLMLMPFNTDFAALVLYAGTLPATELPAHGERS